MPAGGYPIVGMSVADLDRALGALHGVNTSDYCRSIEEQRTYRRGARIWYVYTHAGVVTAIQILIFVPLQRDVRPSQPWRHCRHGTADPHERHNLGTALRGLHGHPAERARRPTGPATGRARLPHEAIARPVAAGSFVLPLHGMQHRVGVRRRGSAEKRRRCPDRPDGGCLRSKLGDQRLDLPHRRPGDPSWTGPAASCVVRQPCVSSTAPQARPRPPCLARYSSASASASTAAGSSSDRG
jgi:hypothetical protein